MLKVKIKGIYYIRHDKGSLALVPEESSSGFLWLEKRVVLAQAAQGPSAAELIHML